ncbi:copper amine oxidase domain-containing protein [Paenibacillus terrae HPL-003]|uniref:Copper amine oxidase domain-containing protein n=1 Tax=Paenibacillus terrae (strain HPL-003) TaxID=985665 RepID=G7VRE5_PAETH|nr:copper amine oxidase N-terminal domain-containing protein [Paenibacillus terrae]AET61324.1 copper amine oxidase domain-containing protein [Paenibacillus terrae HPL-003]
MKRLLTLLLIFVVYFGTIPTIHANPSNYRIFLDGKIVTLQSTPRIESNTLMVPAVPLLKKLGYTAAVDPDIPDRVKISNSNNSITFVMGAKNIYINGKEIRMPISSKSYNGVTYLPLRAISQAIGRPFGSNPTEQYAWIGVAPTKNQKIPPELQGKDFRNAVWGMTVQQIKRSETLPLVNTVTELDDYDSNMYYTYLDYKGEYNGYKAVYTYILSGKNKNSTKLIDGQILFPEKFSNMQNYIDRFFKISSKMQLAYGAPVNTERPRGRDRSKWAEDLSLGNLSLTDYYNVGRNSYYIRLYKSMHAEYPQLDILVSQR